MGAAGSRSSVYPAVRCRVTPPNSEGSQTATGPWFATHEGSGSVSLEPIDRDTALELSLADKENDLADASLKAHRNRLNHFIRWCEPADIENLNTLTGRQLHEYRLWRLDEGALSPVTEKP